MESPRLAWGQGSSDLLGIRPFLTWIFGHCLLFYQDSLHPFDTDHGSFGDPLGILCGSFRDPLGGGIIKGCSEIGNGNKIRKDDNNLF